MENMSFDDLDHLLRVIDIQMVLHILVHGLQFPCCIVTSSLTLWAFSYTHFYAYLLCGICSCAHLIIVVCIIIALSHILLLVWTKLLRSLFMMSSLIILLVFYFPPLMDLIIVHMVLVQKRDRGFMSQYFGYDPCLLCHGDRFPCRHDFQLDSLPLLWDELFWWSTFFLLWDLSSELSLLWDFWCWGFSRVNFSISYSSLKCLIACSPFWALEIA
jgi:hypothetical protein